MAKDEIVVATDDLLIGWAAAHRKGDTLPLSVAKAHGWDDKVARQNTKAAEAAQSEASGDGAENGEGQ